MSPLEILVAARKRIENPKDWGKGPRGVGFNRRPLSTCCAAEAIEEVSPQQFETRIAAFRILRCAIGAAPDRLDAIVEWNDAPDRTHAVVLAAYDRAIEAAQNPQTSAQRSEP